MFANTPYKEYMNKAERYISILYKLKVSKEYQALEIDKLIDVFFNVK